MSDREKKIAEIREALEKATPGPWKWVDVYKKNDFEKYNMGGFVNEEGKLICHFGNRIDYYPTEGEPPDYYDELLIANAPEWLQWAVQEIERLQDELDREREENRKLREEREKAFNLLQKIEDEMLYFGELVKINLMSTSLEEKAAIFNRKIETLKAEREKLIDALQTIRTDTECPYTSAFAKRKLKEIGVTVDE